MFGAKWLFERGAAESEDFEEEDAILFAGFDIDTALPRAGFAVDEVNFAAFLGEQADACLVFVEFESDTVGVDLGILQGCGGASLVNCDDSDALKQCCCHGIGHGDRIACQTGCLGLDIG